VTVSELRYELRKFDDDTEVCYHDWEFVMPVKAGAVELVEVADHAGRCRDMVYIKQFETDPIPFNRSAFKNRRRALVLK
jgi:hypothetical protein